MPEATLGSTYCQVDPTDASKGVGKIIGLAWVNGNAMYQVSGGGEGSPMFLVEHGSTPILGPIGYAGGTVAEETQTITTTIVVYTVVATPPAGGVGVAAAGAIGASAAGLPFATTSSLGRII